MALMKLICNVDEELMKQVDAYAASLHITRTAAVSVLLSSSLKTDLSMTALRDLMEVYKSEKGVLGHGD